MHSSLEQRTGENPRIVAMSMSGYLQRPDLRVQVEAIAD
jgi:hypothetical protein